MMERLILEALRVLLLAQSEQVVSGEVRVLLLTQVAAIRDALAVWAAMEPPDGFSIG
jgi:hypothetical protein